MKKFFFPEEIVTDIISRLPAESVLNCRRVCKTWRTLTLDPSFAHLHLRRLLQLDVDDADDQKYQTTLIKSVDKGYQLNYGEYNDDQGGESYRTLKKINHPPLDHSFYIVGSCNGLICLSVRHHDVKDPVYICNPITREYINLPKLTHTSCKGHVVFGFGYHPRANEYKVVRIQYCKDEPSVGQVQVYTLGDGNGWRNRGEIDRFLRVSPLSLGGVLANGALHWVYGKGKIVSFDLADEEFHFLPSPPCYGGNYQLQVLGGLLCTVHQDESKCVEIWSLKWKNSSSDDVMKEPGYCKSWSWSLEFSLVWEDISLITGSDSVMDFEPFALTKSGEVLFWYCDATLSRYNLKAAIYQDLVEYVPESVFFEATSHMNSFISLKDLGEDAKIMGVAEGVIEPEYN